MLAIYTEIPNQSFKSDVHSEKLKVRSYSFPCNVVHDFEHGCQCRLLAADLDDVKLDMVIMQRNMESSFLQSKSRGRAKKLTNFKRTIS